ncbi:MAG: hypothetical protein ABSC47_14115 [Terracidiphilus sp.]|jgi:hypothetical protein
MANRATSFDTDKLDQEVVETATGRVAQILADSTAPKPTQSPQQVPLPVPVGEPPSSQTEKRTRTTVSKLLQRYQDRLDESAKNVREIESIIAGYQRQLDEQNFKIKFWTEAIAEINAD